MHWLLGRPTEFVPLSPVSKDCLANPLEDLGRNRISNRIRPGASHKWSGDAGWRRPSNERYGGCIFPRGDG